MGLDHENNEPDKAKETQSAADPVHKNYFCNCQATKFQLKVSWKPKFDIKDANYYIIVSRQRY